MIFFTVEFLFEMQNMHSSFSNIVVCDANVLLYFFICYSCLCYTLMVFRVHMQSPQRGSKQQQQQARCGLLFADETPNLATRRRNLCQMPGDVARIKALVYFWRWLILTPAAHRVYPTVSLLPCCCFISLVLFAFYTSSLRFLAVQWQVFKVKRPLDDASTAARDAKRCSPGDVHIR